MRIILFGFIGMLCFTIPILSYADPQIWVQTILGNQFIISPEQPLPTNPIASTGYVDIIQTNPGMFVAVKDHRSIFAPTDSVLDLTNFTKHN